MKPSASTPSKTSARLDAASIGCAVNSQRHEPNSRSGSALAADGYIHNDRYLQWVHNVCSQNHHTLYVPHRRETEESMQVAVTAGAAIDNSGSAFEQILCDAPNVHLVYSLPTTPALTAQTIRPDVDLILENINDWWQQPGLAGMREVVAIVHEILGEVS